jgi:hypothetical protein
MPATTAAESAQGKTRQPNAAESVGVLELILEVCSRCGITSAMVAMVIAVIGGRIRECGEGYCENQRGRCGFCKFHDALPFLFDLGQRIATV